ncbi:peptide transporter ptr2 [Cladophialophora chaetospira]|uniref:Peptide transporter ptr2 n=1 Tax=Cladophialophora chaetospira TaxID=386627 RepID=A0AA38WWM0_9EURO|nr:peptide transporter ptr2 [Cladophialophora chaetospira]
MGEILIPATKDLWLIYIWARPAVLLAPQMVIFWSRFRHLNNDELMVEHDEDERRESHPSISGPETVQSVAEQP